MIYTFSIITVCFNSEKTISKTIESVCNQTILPLEYIIIDGASTDNTLSIINSYARHHTFIKVISEPDKGIYNAMNKGINISNGDMIGIINSDDWYEHDTIKTVMSFCQNVDTAIYYGFMRLLKNGTEYNIERTNYNFLNEKMIQHPTCFIPKKIYLKYGLFNENYKSASDYDFMLRMKSLGIKFVTIDAILVNFSLGGMSSTVQGSIESLSIRKKHNALSKKQFYFKWIELYIKYFFQKAIQYGK